MTAKVKDNLKKDYVASSTNIKNNLPTVRVLGAI